MIREIQRKPISGILMLFVLPTAILVTAVVMIGSFANGSPVVGICALLVLLVLVICLAGFFKIAPNEARVLQLFGSYVGTAANPGLRWANPFYSKRKVSVRIRNFETDRLKVNDSHGNPIEIGAVVVWKVVDTAEAVFEVDDFNHFVRVQSEAALRSLATGYPYDAHHADEISLTGNTSDVSINLQKEIQDRLDKAGVDVIEARISHLAYAQEIAAAMLQRQQASAVVAARQQIVQGAVGMVETALEMLSEQEVVELDEDRKAAMVSNLLVVLCSDRHTQPVVNTGTLHH